MESVAVSAPMLAAERRGFRFAASSSSICTIELPTWLHRGSTLSVVGVAGEGIRSVPYAEADMLFSYRGRIAIVDYHGEAPHEGERSLHHDALRANAFQDLGIPNFALTKRQLFDDALLEKAALQIAGCLGVSLPKQDRRRLRAPQEVSPRASLRSAERVVGDPLNEFWRAQSGRAVRLLIRAKSRFCARSAKNRDPHSRFSVIATRVRFFGHVKAQVGKW